MQRRRFLKTAAAGLLAANSRPAFASGPEPRLPLDKFSRDPVLVVAFRRGVATMQSRKPSDPTSWFFQASIHGVAPDAVAEAAKSDPEVAKLDQSKVWNQCPHFANAASAEFPIWHRGYVYYFERILREASGEP